jgi:hypothetical protein
MISPPRGRVKWISACLSHIAKCGGVYSHTTDQMLCPSLSTHARGSAPSSVNVPLNLQTWLGISDVDRLPHHLADWLTPVGITI